MTFFLWINGWLALRANSQKSMTLVIHWTLIGHPYCASTVNHHIRTIRNWFQDLGWDIKHANSWAFVPIPRNLIGLPSFVDQQPCDQNIWSANNVLEPFSQSGPRPHSRTHSLTHTQTKTRLHEAQKRMVHADAFDQFLWYFLIQEWQRHFCSHILNSWVHSFFVSDS